MIKRILILLIISQFYSCENINEKDHNYSLTISNIDTIEKYIFLDSWLINEYQESDYSENDFFFSKNLLINKVIFWDKDIEFKYNEIKFNSNDIKGSLGESNLSLLLLKPKSKITIEIFKKDINNYKDKNSTHQVFYFLKSTIDSLNSFIIYKSDTISLYFKDNIVFPKIKIGKTINEEDVNVIFNSKRKYFIKRKVEK